MSARPPKSWTSTFCSHTCCGSRHVSYPRLPMPNHRHRRLSTCGPRSSITFAHPLSLSPKKVVGDVGLQLAGLPAFRRSFEVVLSRSRAIYYVSMYLRGISSFPPCRPFQGLPPPHAALRKGSTIAAILFSRQALSPQLISEQACASLYHHGSARCRHQ